VILLGDASSGMWPSLGQGANCALESVAVFTQCLDELSKRKMIVMNKKIVGHES